MGRSIASTREERADASSCSSFVVVSSNNCYGKTLRSCFLFGAFFCSLLAILKFHQCPAGGDVIIINSEDFLYPQQLQQQRQGTLLGALDPSEHTEAKRLQALQMLSQLRQGVVPQNGHLQLEEKHSPVSVANSIQQGNAEAGNEVGIVSNNRRVEVIEADDFVDEKNLFEEYERPRAPRWAIFYNIFIPPEEGYEGVRRGLRIVRLQVDQIGMSYAMRGTNRTTVVYYNTVGMRNALNATYMQELCWDKNRIVCRHMNHYDSAFEEVTLSRAHDYCRKFPNNKAVYMHTKGSYHSSPQNGNWRIFLTESAMSRKCLKPPDRSCNLCGLQFFPLWTTFMAGNFWAADCEYINKLLPPHEYSEKMNQFVDGMEVLASQGRISRTLYSLEERMGNGRFSAETWVGSHPSMRPCDLSTTPAVEYWQKGRVTQDHLRFSMAPRLTFADGPWMVIHERARKALLQDKQKRLREYFLLGGHLSKWLTLYNEIPPDGSWIWEWFPDGELWKDAVREYGVDVYERVANNYALSME